MANLGKHHPTKGDIQVFNGLRHVFTGSSWTLDEVISNTVDRFHNYSGRQGHKRPYGQNRATATLIRTI